MQLFLGETNRTISETPMNMASSRSHCIFTLHIESRQVTPHPQALVMLRCWCVVRCPWKVTQAGRLIQGEKAAIAWDALPSAELLQQTLLMASFCHHLCMDPCVAILRHAS